MLYRQFTRFAVALFVALLSLACNHLFYFPDQQSHGTPEQLDLRFSAQHVTAADGTQLALWLLPHTGKDRHAVVLQFHGNAQNMSTHFLFVAWLVHYGFDVVTFDYRGYGESTGEASRSGLVEDGKAVLSWVSEQAALKDKSIIVLAQSLGGAVAPLALAQSTAEVQGRVRGLVLESTFNSYRDIARGKLDSLWLTWPISGPLSYLVSDDASPIDSVGELRLPIVQIHGTADPVIPIAYGLALYHRVRSRDREFWRVEGGGHTPAFGADNSPWRPRLVRWICRHGGKC